MTLSELIAYCDETRPNQYSNNVKTWWVNEVEARVADDIINRIEGPEFIIFEPYKYDDDKDKDLLLPIQFNDVYVSYIYAKVDFTNAEIERYQADSALFDAAWSDAAAWARRQYKPLRHYQQTRIPPDCGNHKDRGSLIIESCERIKESLDELAGIQTDTDEELIKEVKAHNGVSKDGTILFTDERGRIFTV